MRGECNTIAGSDTPAPNRPLDSLTKEMILNHLYGGMDREPKLKIIDVFVSKLRRKLCPATGGPRYLETVCGRGYMLRDLVEQSY